MQIESKADLSNRSNLEELVNLLKSNKVVFEKGLTNSEIELAEERFNMKFPPDLKNFLQFALPVYRDDSNRSQFPNWRNLNDDYIVGMMAWPLDGIVFDLEHNDFWMDDFGEKPNALEDKIEIVKHFVNNAPRLIPIFSHRFLPAEPCEENNPIFSVSQTDIIYYGAYLYNYLQGEFFPDDFSPTQENQSSDLELKRIRFWSDVIDRNDRRWKND